jgi:hypothetical protein
MAPEHHPTPLSGGDREALQELGKARAVNSILAAQSAEMRAKPKPMLQQADRLLCDSWNERMWADGNPIDPSPTIGRAVNGGFPWLEIRCSLCKTPSFVDMAGMKHLPTTFVHDLASRLRCRSAWRTYVRDCRSGSREGTDLSPGRPADMRPSTLGHYGGTQAEMGSHSRY